MGRKKKYTGELLQEVCAAFEAGLSHKELGEKFGVHPNNISKVARLAGCKRRKNYIDNEKFIDLWTAGVGKRAIADWFGVTVDAVNRKVLKLKLPKRPIIRKLTLEDRAKFKELWEQGVKGIAIAAELGIADTYPPVLARMMGLAPRRVVTRKVVTSNHLNGV